MKVIKLSYIEVACLLACMLLPCSVFADSGYVGSKRCSQCHLEQYTDWTASGHHLQLRSAQKAEHANLPLPQGYSWDDISYVVGGVSKKARFVDQEGYLVTSAKDGRKAKTQYNLEDGSWSYYLPGIKRPFDCAFCHTTGYRSEGHQNDVPAIVGTWDEDGIGCEACHGPGAEHARTPAKSISRGELNSKTCEQCHQRGGVDYRPFDAIGLVRHHEQINELKAGAHKGLSCLNCHDPHKRASSAKKNCTICHSRRYHDYKMSTHGKAEIKCYECHMARVAEAAISRASYIGEVRTHLFKINTDPDANMFRTVEDNDRTSVFMKGFVTVDYVCLYCHGSKDKKWAAQNAVNFHNRE